MGCLDFAITFLLEEINSFDGNWGRDMQKGGCLRFVWRLRGNFRMENYIFKVIGTSFNLLSLAYVVNFNNCLIYSHSTPFNTLPASINHPQRSQKNTWTSKAEELFHEGASLMSSSIRWQMFLWQFFHP